MSDRKPSDEGGGESPILKARWQGLGIRIATALGILLIVVMPFYVGGWAWAALVALFSSRILYEWLRMSDPKVTLLGRALAFITLFVTLLYAVQGLLIESIIAVLALTVAAIIERWLREKENGAIWTAIGLPYVIFPSAVLILLRGSEIGFETRGFTQIIFVIILVIAVDAGAYFGGSQIGGPKLAPKLSPNKTWAGAISGAVAGSLFAVITALFIGLSVPIALLISFPIIILAILGDLFESLLKRRLGVKDTGALLPGHGGLLDRFDSLIAAIVGAAVIFALMGDRWPII